MSKLTLLLKEGKISQERLEAKCWEVKEVFINDNIVKSFVDACNRGRCKRRLDAKASRIFSRVVSQFEMDERVAERTRYSSDENDAESDGYKDGYEHLYDEEDFMDDWWKRNEDYPYEG